MVQLEPNILQRYKEIKNSFNSIMVQLELSGLRSVPAMLTTFNSIMVQLERPADAILDRPLFLFQFHYGSIRTFLLIFKLVESISFNSIMVQLELSNYLITKTLHHVPFNSIMVQLEPSVYPLLR